MRRVAILLSFAGVGMMAQLAHQPTDWQGWLGQGVQAFKNARYDDAITAFQKAADMNPTEVMPRLYLATAYMQKYIPGATSPEMQDTASRAEAEFMRVLALDPNNRVAMASLGSLEVNQKKWREAREWYQRVIALDPNNRDAYYTLGFIAWSEWYPSYGAARSRLGMRMEDPGPLPEGAVKQDLQNRFMLTIEEGMANLKRALEIDSKYDDAMAYMNLFIRERADLRSSRAEYLAEIREADDWVQKALETKKEKAATMTPYFSSAPPPPPPGQGGGAGDRRRPSRIIIAPSVQASKLVSQTPPVYPETAKQARIMGAVRLEAVIGKDGSIVNLQLISGHPLLVPAALDAVKQWRYQPTLLNGEPVEVQTVVEINFILPQ